MTVAAKKRNIMRELEIKEISGVDFPAQEGAKALLMKRADPDEVEKFDLDFANPRMTNVKTGHQHLLDDSGGRAGMTTWETSSGKENGHQHPWIRQADGSIKIGMAEGHDHELLPLEKQAETGGSVPDGGRKDKEKSMSDDTTKKTAADDDAVKERLEKIEAELKFAKQYGELNDAEKAHYDKLGEDERKEFVSKDEGARRRDVEKVAGENPVVYTSDAGEEFRKNDDVRLVRLAKQSDEDRKLAKTERDLRLDTELTKRAEKELSNVGGKLEGKKALLKAIDGITDEKVREEATSIVAAANKALSGLFNSIGRTNAGPQEGGDPYDELEELAKTYSVDHKVDIVKARSLVLDTPEGAELYAKMAGR